MRADDYPVPPPPAVSTSSTLAYYWADHVDYLTNSEVLHLKGNVIIRESTYTIKGDEMWLDNRTRVARADGFFYVSDSSGAVAGKKGGEFDLVDHSGYIDDVYGGDAGWRIHAREGDMEELEDKKGPYRKVDYWSADFTSCDRVPDPHYHFHATHLRVYPGRYLLGYNDVFYLGKYPVFYTPIVYKSLKGDKNALGLTAQAGYDKRNGYFLKGTQTHSWDPTTYSKLFLDKYSTVGWGEGAELEHRKGVDRAELFGYHITENVSHLERWATVGNFYQTLASSGTNSLAAQGRLQLQSDPDFNNNYNRNNLLPVSPQLLNSGALVYRTRIYTARVFYNSIQNATIINPGNPSAAGNSKYFMQTEQAPAASIQTIPLKFGKLPWLNTFSGQAENLYNQGQNFIQKDVVGSWTGSQGIHLVHGVTMTPSLTYSEQAYNQFDELANSTGTTGLVANQFNSALVGRYTGQDVLRFDTPAGKMDLTYAYTRRFHPDTFDADINASDHGVEQNLVSFEEAFRPTRRVFVRATTGYDFRVWTYQQLQAYQRIQPITGEVYYTPTPKLTLSLRDDYLIQQGNRSFLGDISYGNPKGTFIETSAGYNLGQADSYFTSLLIGYEPSTFSWRVSGVLRSLVVNNGNPDNFHRFDLFDKELVWVKYWHDFTTQAMVIFRPGGVREFTARAQFRLPGGQGKPVEHRDWESEWFPERKTGLYDRP